MSSLKTKTPTVDFVSQSKWLACPRRGLSREEAANYVGVSPSKFDEMRKDGRIGPPKLIDTRKVWDIHQLDEAFDALPEDRTQPDQQNNEWNPQL
jgi:hypothetical protein